MGFLVSTAATCGLTLGLIAGLNAVVDPAGLLDGAKRAEAAATALLAGQKVPLSNADDRRLQRAYANAMVKAPDVLVVGSSRMMQVEAPSSPGRTFYNAAMSSMTLDDLFALAELFIEREDHPKVMVIGIDHWLFDAVPLNARWAALEPEVQAMRHRLLLPPARGGREPNVAANLLSLDYAEESLRELQAAWRLRGTRADDGDSFANGAKLPDGSIVYGAAFAGRTTTDIDADAEMDGLQFLEWHKTAEPLALEALQAFERLAVHLRARGVTLVLVVPPHHPDTYALARASSAGGHFDALRDAVEGIAARTGARVVGSSDPAAAGCSRDEFWDGVHPKPECLRRLVAPALGTSS
jgi:hypothetical protein